MDKALIREVLEDLVFEQWGTTKTVTVIGGALLGATIGALAAIRLAVSKNINE